MSKSSIFIVVYLISIFFIFPLLPGSAGSLLLDKIIINPLTSISDYIIELDSVLKNPIAHLFALVFALQATFMYIFLENRYKTM